MSEDDFVPAIPPLNYQGSIADWCCGLIAMGVWDGNDWYVDVEITNEQWFTLLEDCEGVLPGDCSMKCDGDKHHKTCRRNSK